MTIDPYSSNPKQRLLKAIHCMRKEVNAADTYARCFSVGELKCFHFYLFLPSILTVHTLALVESKKEKLGDAFKEVSLSPKV